MKKIYRYIKKLVLNILFIIKYYILNYDNKPKLYILMDPNHDNIGDQGIAYAQKKFLNDNFPNYKKIFFSEDLINSYKNLIFKFTQEKDIIFLIGGGNFGDEYMHHENMRREIIQKLNRNTIVMFPQTMHFKENDNGQNQLNKSIEIYSKCDNLILIAREEISYNLMKKYFSKNTILFMPDIVLYINEERKNNRQGIVTCFRNDDEVVLSDNDKKKIFEILNQKFDSLIKSDMRWGKPIKDSERDYVVQQKFEQFSKAKLVVTDRLHGMIFCAITGTPCIVFSNYNHKVKGTYEWIKHLDYIKYSNTVDEFMEYLENMDLGKNYNYDNTSFIKRYDKIIENLKVINNLI